MKSVIQKINKMAVAMISVLSLLAVSVLPAGVSASSSSTGTGVVGGTKLTSSDVAHVEVEPIEIIENTYGDWQLYVDEDTGEEIEYYCYDWSAFISYTITLKNGDVIEAPGGYFSYNGVDYPLVYFHSHQSYENRWLAGNTYTIEHTILGEEYEFPVTIVESPVASIRCDTEEIVIREGTYCDLLPDGASELYRYRWYEAANWIVTYTDGREETTYDRIVEIDGHNYAFEFTDAQATLQNWTAGNTYTGYAEFLGAKCDVDVRITDSFIQNIVFDPIYVYANADGMMNTQYDYELGRDREYFRYNWRPFLSYTATLFDGTVIEGTGDSLYHDNEWYWFETADTQSLYTPWETGQTYPVEIAVLGETYMTGVQVVPNPVENIQFPDIVIPQGLYGETVEEYDALTNKIYTYFQYDVQKFFDYIVSFADGTTVEATYNGFRYDNRSYGARIVGGMQNHNNVWEPGKVYHITVNVMGTELVVPVYIQPITEAEGFGYTRNYDGTITITECSKTDERLTIPSTIGEYTVTEIQSIDIAEEYITEIVIPRSVTRLSWCDFTAFDKLTTIYYEGSENDWRDISHYYGGYGELTIVYNYASDVPADPVTDLLYEISGGEVTITGYSGEGGDVVIPATIGGYPVTSIEENVFSFCSSLESITIPDSVTSIGYGAFYGCSSLTSVTIPDRVTSIGDWAFSDCSSLTSIAVDENNTAYTSLDGVLFNKAKTILMQYPAGKTNPSYAIPDSVTSIGDSAFDCCSSLTSITIPDGVTSIGYQAFDGCSSLTSVTIPNSVTSIENYAFRGCSSLISITIPNSVTSIDDYTFFRCNNLTSVTVGENNTAYTSQDGVLFNKAKTILKHYPAGKTNPSYAIPDSVTSIENDAFSYCSSLTSIAIPDSVTSIGANAFENCSSLTSVTIPDSVTSIDDFAFSGCSNLTSIVIPNSVTSIGYGAFEDCSSLTDVWYEGTESDREALEIGEENDYLLSAIWHYADDTTEPIYLSGDVNDDGKVNNKDLGLLLQYLNNWDVTVVEEACDVNADDKINNKDLGILLQYLNNWDVELK